MTIKRLPQKLVTFSDNEAGISEVENELKHGWNIVSLVSNGSNYFCILEKGQSSSNDGNKIYIPPRKKIKISRS